MVKAKQLEINQRKIWMWVVMLAAVIMMAAGPFSAYGAGGLELNTAYTGMTVKPGESLNLSITLDNGSGAGMDADLSIASMPEGWEGYIQGGSYEVSRVYVAPGDAGAQVTLHLTVPKDIAEGTYNAVLQAVSESGAADSLNLEFHVNERVSGAGSFSSEYPQQEGTTGTSFSFSTTLINNGLTSQSYSLSSDAPAGWSVSFTPSGESTKVAGIDVESGASQGLTVAVVPPENIAAGEYDISCSAVSAAETLNTDLKVVITGTYDLSLSTPDGRLSFDAYANQESDVTLNVTNMGNVDLEQVSINSSAPSGWVVTYNLEDNIIKSLPAGTTTEVIAHVKPGSDIITGDYVLSFSASSDGASSSADFRVSVKTKTIWGVVAVLIILGTAGGLGWVFRKYGRR